MEGYHSGDLKTKFHPFFFWPWKLSLQRIRWILILHFLVYHPLVLLVWRRILLWTNISIYLLKNVLLSEPCLMTLLPLRRSAGPWGRDCTSISKEVRNHMLFQKTGCLGRPFNDCANRRNCPVSGLCSAPACAVLKSAAFVPGAIFTARIISRNPVPFLNIKIYLR